MFLIKQIICLFCQIRTHQSHSFYPSMMEKWFLFLFFKYQHSFAIDSEIQFLYLIIDRFMLNTTTKRGPNGLAPIIIILLSLLITTTPIYSSLPSLYIRISHHTQIMSWSTRLPQSLSPGGTVSQQLSTLDWHSVPSRLQVQLKC